MKVIFLQPVKAVAKSGDVKDVADGYARNFLIPRRLAEPATAEALRELVEFEKKREKMAEADLARVEHTAEFLDGFELILKAKVSLNGILFAGITAKRIAEELGRRGFEVTEKNVVLNNIAQIKELGEYDVLIQLEHGLEAEVKVIVESV